MRHGYILALPLAALVAGCSWVEPFATEPAAAKPAAHDAGVRVGVCYNTLKTPADGVQKLAQEQCTANTTAERIDTDYRLDACPLSTPGRATFVCKPN